MTVPRASAPRRRIKHTKPQLHGVVDLKTPDGTTLKATYFGAAKPGPGVLLLRQSNRDRKSWDREAAQLAAAGFNTLTLHMRGFGESSGARGGFKRMPEDVDTALQFLMSQPE
jgi:predicted alpha/beta hydrolase